MVICSHVSALIANADRTQVFPIPNGAILNVPEWVAEAPYFKALVSDGMIDIPKSSADKDVVPAAEKEAPIKRKGGKK